MEVLFFAFPLTTGITRNYWKKQEIKRRKVIILLCYPEANDIETIMPQTLAGLDISHGEYKSIIKEQEN